MLVKPRGSIQSFDLPDEFALVEEVIGGRSGDNWQFIYGPDDSKNVVISFSYRGFPVVDLRTEPFRRLLEGGDSNIFDRAKPDENAGKIIRSISRVLGDEGDNQLNNFDTGKFGPVFEVERLDVVSINGKAVLKLNGWYQDEERNPTKRFSGIYIDGSPALKNSQVEELHLMTENEELFKTYKPAFENLLNSIKWNQK